MATVRWTIGAQQDLQAIVEYIARDSPAYAAATASRIVAAIRNLRRNPRLGRTVPEFADASLRELIVFSYRVIYKVNRSRVGIVAIVHGSRDLLRRLPLAEWSF